MEDTFTPQSPQPVPPQEPVPSAPTPTPEQPKRSWPLILVLLVALIGIAALAAWAMDGKRGMDGRMAPDAAAPAEMLDPAGAVPETSDLEAEFNSMQDASIDQDIDGAAAVLESFGN